MQDFTSRRRFLKTVAATSGAFAAGAAAINSIASGADSGDTRPAASRVAKVDHPVVMGIIGTGDRGSAVASGFASLPGAIVKYVCDVDSHHSARAAGLVSERQERPPTAVEDLRRVLDDHEVEAVAIATPDHWHAPAAILACAAGKHVYLEKPCCHNPREGELLAAAIQKHDRIFQHGTQRRSWPRIVEAISRVQTGEIGKVFVSRAWYDNTRLETGRRIPASIPPGLNWNLWQGPAPQTPFTENVVPYKWHWYWNWGTGELGNNGVHGLDLCRWGLGVEFPRRVTAGGGRYHFKDDQETPDTLSVTYDFGDRAILWEGRSCHPRGVEGSAFGVAFYGDRATLIIQGGGSYRILDLKGKEVESVSGPAGDAIHLQHFIDSVRSGAKPVADVVEATRSALLCHLGNIAFRSGGAVSCDAANGHIIGNPAAEKLWARTYQKEWEPQV